VVIGLVVAARLRRRHVTGTFYRRLGGAGVFTCGQCHATWPAASRRDGLATARIHAATSTPAAPLPAASPATPRAGAPTRPGSSDAPPQPPHRKDLPMLRPLARLALVVLVIAGTALVLAVYAHNAAATP
jgi:hypothetical protein